MTRSQCKVSDTQVTVKACGPLVYIIFCFHSDESHSNNTSDYESTEVFDDTIESLQREVTTEIGGF